MHTVQYKGANTRRGPSPNIWADCPIIDLLEDPGKGFYRHWDLSGFKTATNVNAAEAYWAEGLKLFGDSGAAVAAVDAVGGGITIGSDGDNEGASFAQMVAPMQISRSHNKSWFEVEVKSSTISDTKHGIFTGLGEIMALSATVPIAAAGTLADQNFVGFHRLEGDGDYFDCVYKANGVTQVTVQADAQILVADTYVKLGFSYNPDSFLLTFFGNGLKIGSVTVIAAAGTDFPNDVRLGVIGAVLNATASTPGTSSFRWVRAAQLY